MGVHVYPLAGLGDADEIEPPGHSCNHLVVSSQPPHREINAITLHVADLARSIGFYQLLGGVIVFGGPDAPFCTLRLAAGADNFVNLQRLDGFVQPSGAWGRVIFHVDSPDELYAKALAAGLTPEMAPSDASWGERYFHLRDPDGHEISLARRLVPAPTERAETLIRRYFDRCNAADRQGLIDCFTPDAVHYFPPGLPGTPWRSAEAIADGWLWCVEHLGSRWTIEKILVGPDGREAVIEWTHWKTAMGEVLRGDEWYRFDDAISRITEIRAYYASPVDKSAPVNQLNEFDYQARGYALVAPVDPYLDVPPAETADVRPGEALDWAAIEAHLHREPSRRRRHLGPLRRRAVPERCRQPHLSRCLRRHRVGAAPSAVRNDRARSA